MTPSPSTPAPPKRKTIPFWVWLCLAALLGGIFAFGAYTFAYAQGTSYLSDDAAACANCHIMRDVYQAWTKSSHKAVAACNDCHTPHTSILEKYAVKGINGVNHSWAFTSGRFPEPIQITDFNKNVALQNCTYCHSTAVSMIDHAGNTEKIDCLLCHATVGHDQNK